METRGFEPQRNTSDLSQPSSAPMYKKIAVLVIILALIGGGVWYFKFNNTNYKGPELTKGQAEKLAKEIGKHVQIPTDSPTGVVIGDKQKLSGNNFFNDSQNNDVVLIFQESNKAIIYRPSTKKVITMATLNANNQQTNTPITPKTDETK